MCGICGVWGKASPESANAMVSALHHRGPDDDGLYQDQTVALGMARLAIIDLSSAGHQPMSNPEKTIWIVYNGELYNFQSERNLLETQGYAFTSQSDTEVVMRLYERYGDDFLKRLRGMFALAIYDKRQGPGRERLLLARDQVGIKPLLYARVGDRFVFASELKALLASGMVQPQIDPVALRYLLTYGSIYQPRTMLKDVKMLLPAHRLIIEGGRQRIERYWSFGLDRYPDLRHQPYDELVMQVGNALEESVRLHMVSDVPVGAFLSGGVDSSFIVGLMTRIAGSRVKTFSVGFEAEGHNLDETDEAGQAARFFGADHTRVVVRGTDLRERLSHVICGLDQPSVDGVNSYFVSMVARQAVTVAMSGTGGDELFAGYPWFIQMALYEEQMQKNAQTLRTGRRDRPSKQSVFHRLLSGVWRDQTGKAHNNGFLAHYANTFSIFGPLGTVQLTSPELHMAMGVNQLSEYDLELNDELPAGMAVERVSALCLRGYTQNQLLRDIDAMSMAHSLEVRVPFLDVPMIDLSLSIPASAKLGNVSTITNSYAVTYRDSGSKKILVDAGRRMGILPENIDLQPKRGFTFPMDFWLRDSLREVMDDTLSEQATRARGLLQPQEVERVKQDFLEEKLHWTQPWLLMVLELWCREFLD